MINLKKFENNFNSFDLTTWVVIFGVWTNKYYNLNPYLGIAKVNNFVDILVSTSDLAIIWLVLVLFYVNISSKTKNSSYLRGSDIVVRGSFLLVLIPILINPSYGILIQGCRLFVIIRVLLAMFSPKFTSHFTSQYLHWVIGSLVVFSSFFDHYLISSSLPTLLLFLLWKSLQNKLNNWQKNCIYSYIFLNFITAFWQVLVSQSLGLIYFGEPNINAQMLNIARENIFGQNVLRGYGLTQHSGILGFVGSWSVIFTLNQRDKNRLSVIFSIVLSLLSLSRIAWLGLFVPLVILLLKSRKNLTQTFPNKSSKNNVGIIFGIILSSSVILSLFVYRFGRSDKYRMLDYQNFGSAISNFKINDWLVGVGYYPKFLWQNLNVFASPIAHQNWEFQPVHNMFLNILVQWGILGCLGWIGLIYSGIAKR